MSQPPCILSPSPFPSSPSTPKVATPNKNRKEDKKRTSNPNLPFSTPSTLEFSSPPVRSNGQQLRQPRRPKPGLVPYLLATTITLPRSSRPPLGRLLFNRLLAAAASLHSSPAHSSLSRIPDTPPGLLPLSQNPGRPGTLTRLEALTDRDSDSFPFSLALLQACARPSTSHTVEHTQIRTPPPLPPPPMLLTPLLDVSSSAPRCVRVRVRASPASPPGQLLPMRAQLQMMH
uniref:Uncharacterized protein n=1 Tax=Mustela putorius furo TaxID=9669 RepID=M3YJ55_MUSPF